MSIKILSLIFFNNPDTTFLILKTLPLGLFSEISKKYMKLDALIYILFFKVLSISLQEKKLSIQLRHVLKCHPGVICNGNYFFKNWMRISNSQPLCGPTANDHIWSRNYLGSTMNSLTPRPPKSLNIRLTKSLNKNYKLIMYIFIESIIYSFSTK